jgi:ribosomal protein L7/L12
MADVKELAEQLVNLSVKEVNELADVLKDEYGIEPAAQPLVMAEAEKPLKNKPSLTLCSTIPAALS